MSSFVDRLGNMLPLEAPTNRALGNADFEAKLAAYSESSYATARDLAQHRPPSWNPRALEARQARLAKTAARVWRLDYA